MSATVDVVVFGGCAAIVIVGWRVFGVPVTSARIAASAATIGLGVVLGGWLGHPASGFVEVVAVLVLVSVVASNWRGDNQARRPISRRSWGFAVFAVLVITLAMTAIAASVAAPNR